MERGIDEVIAEVATGQHACFSRDQVRDRVDRHALARRTRSGLLVAESDQVFRLAAAPRTDEQRVKMATLDVPGSAVAWAFTAAWLWQFPGFPLRGIEVATQRQHHRPSSLGWVHHPRLWLPEHVTTWRGIDVSSVALTIYALAGRIHPERLNRLVVNVCKRSQAVHEQLHDLLPVLAACGRNGITNMRWVLDKWPRGCTFPDSGNEVRFEDVLAAAGITGLRRQVDLGGHEWIGRVDYLCELTAVVYEIDSELHHTSPDDVANDARRDAALLEAGHPEVVRISTERLWSHPHEIAWIVRRTRAKYLRPAA